MDLTVLSKMVIEIPLSQVGVFALVSVLLTLMGKVRFTLPLVYGFIMYWVFILNQGKFGFSTSASLLHTVLFIAAGIIFAGCSIWVVFIEK